MNFIVLDLEWNQCPTGKANEEEALPFEIIEIGAIRTNEKHELLDRFCEVIKPQVYPTLHEKTRQIVSLRAIDFRDARHFPEVAEDFLAWCGKDPLFCTWGPADLMELQRNLAYYKLKNPFSLPLFYYDIQKIFSIAFEDRKTRRSLEYAVDYLHIEKPIPFHNALSDAFYTALIMQHLTEKQIISNSSVDYFRTPQNRRQEIYIKYQTYSKFVSKPYESKTAAMKDRVLTSVICPECRRTAAKKIHWFSHGARNYYCIAYCSQHGYLKGKIRLRQRSDQKFYAVKTIKPVSLEEAIAVRDKKNNRSARLLSLSEPKPAVSLSDNRVSAKRKRR